MLNERKIFSAFCGLIALPESPLVNPREIFKSIQEPDDVVSNITRWCKYNDLYESLIKECELVKDTHSTNIQIEEMKYLLLRLMLQKLETFEDIFSFAEKYLQGNDFFFKRIKELKFLADDEEDLTISLDSFRSLVVFCFIREDVIEQITSITVGDSGYFYLSWEKNKEDSVNIRFDENFFCNYVIFHPSTFQEKRSIFNGGLHLVDIILFIKKMKFL